MTIDILCENTAYVIVNDGSDFLCEVVVLTDDFLVTLSCVLHESLLIVPISEIWIANKLTTNKLRSIIAQWRNQDSPKERRQPQRGALANYLA